MQPDNENEAYAEFLCGHLEGFTARLPMLKPDEWDRTPDPAAPTARMLATHAWQWLQCDRRHIAEPDAAHHSRIPEPPDDPAALCDALAEETKRWRALLNGLTPDQLAAPRRQFNNEGYPLNVRWFVVHMTQNTIYKHGQFSTLFFALGHDGTEPYTAPCPNPIYSGLFGPAPGVPG